MSLGRPINLTANIASKSVSITATAEQTEFSPAGGYRIDQIAVYRNGTRLVNGQDFTARDGATVTLVSAATIGDTLEFQIFDSFNVANTINTNSSDQTINGSLTVTNGLTAATFSGDGSGLTGVGTANVSTSGLFVVGVSTLSGNVQIPDSTSLNLGNDDDLELFHTAGGNTHIKNNTGELEIRGNTTKIFNKNASQTIAGFTQGASVGITTVGILTAYDTTQSTSASTGAVVIHGGVGIAKSLFVDGNVTIGGTLTYEDMTNTDNLGFGTFRKGIEVQGAGSTTTTLNVTGVSTLTGQANIGSGVTINSTGIEVTSGIITAGTCFKAGGGSFGPGIGATILGSGNAVFAGIVTAATLKYGTTSVETAIDAKASTGKAIAMAMVFGF